MVSVFEPIIFDTTRCVTGVRPDFRVRITFMVLRIGQPCDLGICRIMPFKNASARKLPASFGDDRFNLVAFVICCKGSIGNVFAQ